MTNTQKAKYRTLLELTLLFCFYLIISFIYYYFAKTDQNYLTIFLKFIYLFILTIILAYLLGEFTPTTSTYFGFTLRTQIFYLLLLLLILIVSWVNKKITPLEYFSNSSNIVFWLIVWFYFNIIAPVLGLLSRLIFPISVLFISSDLQKSQKLKLYGYQPITTVEPNQFLNWLKSNSNENGKINNHYLVLVDTSNSLSEPLAHNLNLLSEKYFADFIALRSTSLLTYFTGRHTILISKYPHRTIQYRLKRLIDYTISLLTLLLIAPLFIAIVICIKLDSPGPVFYRHRRLGRNMIPFNLLKFRTMYQDAEQKLKQILDNNLELKKEYERSYKLKNDPRITKIGKILRKFSIDELPQIFNVINGTMSLIGPRPIVEEEITYYQKYSLALFRVLPGISGLWQTSGRTETTYEKRVILDTEYVLNWSLLKDIKLLCKTIPTVISQRGAY